MLQGRTVELERLQNITTYNTLAIANQMKKVWKDSDEYDPYKYVCNKLLYLYIDAMKFLGSPLCPR